MQGINFVKVAAVSVAALWLAGCSTAGSKGAADLSNAPVVTDEMVVETQPVLDPSVQAVIDSGQISADANQVEKLLNQNQYQFGFDSSKLTDQDYKALDVQAAYLNSSAGRGKTIVIEGHTDERGTRTYNLALGERRANAVKNYLVTKGVAASRIEVISFGFEKPLDPAHTESAWGKNRRAVIVLN